LGPARAGHRGKSMKILNSFSTISFALMMMAGPLSAQSSPTDSPNPFDSRARVFDFRLAAFLNHSVKIRQYRNLLEFTPEQGSYAAFVRKGGLDGQEVFLPSASSAFPSGDLSVYLYVDPQLASASLETVASIAEVTSGLLVLGCAPAASGESVLDPSRQGVLEVFMAQLGFSVESRSTQLTRRLVRIPSLQQSLMVFERVAFPGRAEEPSEENSSEFAADPLAADLSSESAPADVSV
jgi:hypothetical protein